MHNTWWMLCRLCQKMSSFLRTCTCWCVIFHPRPSFIKGHLPSKVVFHPRSSSIKGHLSSKVVSHQRLSFIKGHLPSKVVFHQRSSSLKGRLPSKVVFHQRSSSIKGHLPSKVVFHQRSSSNKGRTWVWHCSAMLNNPSWISGVPKPLSEASRSPNQCWTKSVDILEKDRRYTDTYRNWHAGPVLTPLALDKKLFHWILRYTSNFL